MNKMSLLKNYKSIFITAFICFVSTVLVAQDYDYLQEAYKSVSEGDCGRAQKLYNVYKAMLNNTDFELERQIEECNNSSKQFKIGEMIQIDGRYYP